jgi:hypothetical protein
MLIKILFSFLISYYVINSEWAYQNLKITQSNKTIYCIMMAGVIYYLIKSFFGSSESFVLPTGFTVGKDALDPDKYYFVGALSKSNTVTPAQNGGETCGEFPPVVYKLAPEVPAQCQGGVAGTSAADPTASNVESNYSVSSQAVSGMKLRNIYSTTAPLANILPEAGRPFVIRNRQQNTFLTYAISGTTAGALTYTNDRTKARAFVINYIYNPIDKVFSTTQFNLQPAINLNQYLSLNLCPENNPSLNFSPKYAGNDGPAECPRPNYGFQWQAWAFSKITTGLQGLQLVSVYSNKYKVHPRGGTASSGNDPIIYAEDGDHTIYDWQYE